MVGLRKGQGVAKAFRVYAAEELGKDGYPAEWHAAIKHTVREEGGNRCARCGHPYTGGEHGSGEWSACDEECTHLGPARVWMGVAWDEATEVDVATGTIAVEKRVDAHWRILTVHHLDGDKANCRWWNLAALCQRCHLTIQGRVLMARIWPWEHTEWFRPYVAGYYAFVYLGENLTRDETLTRMDELLALERMA